MVLATNLGYPRIGPRRELKKALEAFWAGKIDGTILHAQAAMLRRNNWLLQKQLGIDHIPSNDFSLYDHVLDTIAMVGAVPPWYQWDHTHVELHTYFAMARGIDVQQQDEPIAAMEMSKWFDTNYHYIVPEFVPDQQFHLASTKPLDEFCEAQALGIHTRPVLLGPVSFLLLGKTHTSDVHPLSLLDRLLPVYEKLLAALAQHGADWIQMDEPCLVLDLDDTIQTALQQTYERLAHVSPQLHILLATYFGALNNNLACAVHLPVAALHIDLVRAPEQLEHVLTHLPPQRALSLGLVNGRNIWRTDCTQALSKIERAVAVLGPDRVLIAPSCSLLHTPIDLDQETQLDSELRSWLAFANQKLAEIATLTQACNHGPESVSTALSESQQACESRRTSLRVHNPAVAQRLTAISEDMLRRQHSYAERKPEQRAALHLPLLPTTTIGSFPQTTAVRTARSAHTKGELTTADYEKFLREAIAQTIHFQEELGFDVLVHGEFERSDMVEYFGEQLQGMTTTQHAWVQSYGSRCVRPPIIFGDVYRPQPMTVRWSTYAQSLTKRPIKGMITGPVTILQWSFVRDDQPRATTCQQLALAIRDEVLDLEAAGIKVIQIDEPALREGLPLRHTDWLDYLRWAVDSFRLAAAGVRDETQIHTHMCYAEFNDIIADICSMDADVISIEASRSHLELLDAFVTYHYPNDIGPGVYDIHSPRVPSQQELEQKLRAMLRVLPAEQLWVNPDCGLKTRRWEEIQPALTHLVEAAQAVRKTLLPSVMKDL